MGKERKERSGKGNVHSLSLSLSFLNFYGVFFYSLLQSKLSRLRGPILSEREERRGKGGDGG